MNTLRQPLECAGSILTIVMVALSANASTKRAWAEEPAGTTPAAASQTASVPPIENIPPTTVLVRLGNDYTITQGDFERFAGGQFPARYNRSMLTLLQEYLLDIYAKDHPEIVSDKEIDQMIEEAMKKGKTREQVIAGIEKQGMNLETFYRRNRVRLLRKALILKGDKLSDDEEYRKKLYAEDPAAFNDTAVRAQHVLVWVFPHDTPEEIEKQRETIESIRQRLLSGQLSWDAAQDESHSGLGTQAKLGWIGRHSDDVNEAVTEAALKLKPGETSPVVRSGVGFHFVQVLERREGNRPLENPDTRLEMRRWLEKKFLFEATQEAEKKHPVVGVRPPARTPLMAQREFRRPPPMVFGTQQPASAPAEKK